MEKLTEELRDKSDSESFDDEKERLLNIKKANEADQLRNEVKNLNAEIETLKLDSKSNLYRIQNQLKFSQDANKALQTDYEFLQEKFDKHMKATNNINEDLKEEIERLLQLTSRLQMQVDDADKIIFDEKKKVEAQVSQTLLAKDELLAETLAEKTKFEKELKELKVKHHEQMQKVKLMELEINQLEDGADKEGQEDGNKKQDEGENENPVSSNEDNSEAD